MRHHLEQSALGGGERLRHAVDRLRQQLAVAQDAEASGSFSDERVTPWQKRDRPRLHKAISNSDDAVIVQGRSEGGVAGNGHCPCRDQGDGHCARNDSNHHCYSLTNCTSLVEPPCEWPVAVVANWGQLAIVNGTLRETIRLPARASNVST